MRIPLGHSLRARLLLFLLASIFVAALVQAVVAYRGTLAQTDAIFDAQLRNTALSLSAGSGRLGAPPMPVPGEPVARVEDLIIQIWTADGTQLYRSASGRLLPDPVVLGFSDVRSREATYRVYAMATPLQVTQVAQDTRVRSATARALALRSVGPIVAAAPLLMLVVWWVVGLSLEPVARTRAQLAARRPDDLSPVSDADLPDEVRPLVQELNLLLERVRQAFALQQQFVGDAAHELRTPLAALALQLQGLRRAGDDAATREQAIARLSDGVARATRLIEQLLSMARYDGGSPAPALVPTDLVQAVREAVAQVLPAANARRIELALEGPDQARVAGQSDALVLLARNLLDNAVKYTLEGGRVDIGIAAAPQGMVTLTIDDTGPGIPPAERERVFDRFYRIDPGQAQGSGLGLSLVRTLARRHGAEVTLADAPGGGLRVTVAFHAAAGSAATGSSAPPAGP